ncbi:MAG: Lin0512 family protein [Chloroflexi bacterium]|nr:Lin0512 family protein [Chloroflexota bacterium]
MASGEMLLETGMGVDLHGADATKAARRAVEDAVRRVSLLFLRTLSRERRVRVSVDVTIGVPNPEAVDREAVAALLPVGKVNVRCERGGLSLHLGEGEEVLLAVAAVVVRLDP